MNASASSYRYMSIVGAANRWIYVVFAFFAATIAYLRATGDRPNTMPYFFFFLVPIAAGTGLLTSGRRGELDLLFGAGQTRARLWWAALVRAWGVPALMSILILILTGPLTPTTSVASTLVRLVPVLLFTGGVGFATGLVELRYLAGVIWLLLRLIFVLTPPGLNTIVRLSKGVDVPSTGALLLSVIAAPETLLEPSMPVGYVVLGAAAGIAALAASYVWFLRAELGGKRQ